MKLRNLAFFGVMASILGVNGAYADTATVIASQAYVDAHKNDTDVHVTTAKKANWDSAYSDTSGAATTNALAETDDTKLTKVSSIKDMLTTSVGATGVDTKVPTEKAVRAAIAAVDVSGAVDDGTNGTETAAELSPDDKKAPSTRAVTDMVSTTDIISADTTSDAITGVATGDNAHVPTTAVVSDVIKKMKSINATDTTGNAKPVVSISQQNGQVTVTKGTLATTAIEFSDKEKAALASGIDTGGVAQITTNKNAIATNADNITTLKGDASTTGSVLNSIKLNSKDGDYSGSLHTANNGVNTLQQAIDVNATAIAGKEDTSNKVTSVTSTSTDTEYPSAKAVYAVSAAAATDTAPSATWDDTAKEIVYATSGAAGNKTDKLATSAQVSTSVQALETQVNNTMVSKANATVPAGGDYKAISAGSTNVGSNLVALDEAVKAIAENAVEKNEDITASTTNSIVTYDEKGLVTGGIDLNNTMHDINNATADATCSATNPCVLSYLGDTVGYRWTAMDLDGLSVNGGSSSN